MAGVGWLGKGQRESRVLQGGGGQGENGRWPFLSLSPFPGKRAPGNLWAFPVLSSLEVILLGDLQGEGPRSLGSPMEGRAVTLSQHMHTPAHTGMHTPVHTGMHTLASLRAEADRPMDSTDTLTQRWDHTQSP